MRCVGVTHIDDIRPGPKQMRVYYLKSMGSNKEIFDKVIVSQWT